MRLSSNLTPWCLVEKRGDKLVRAGAKTKRPYGVWYPYPETITIKTRLLDGSLHTESMEIPAGVRVYGISKALIDMQPRKETKIG